MIDRNLATCGPATAVIPLALLAAPAASLAQEASFSEATIYFELNDSDSDLGIHGLIDGDEWRRPRIDDPNERVILDVDVLGRLARQGLTSWGCLWPHDPGHLDRGERGEHGDQPRELDERAPVGLCGRAALEGAPARDERERE